VDSILKVRQAVLKDILELRYGIIRFELIENWSINYCLSRLE